MLNDNAQKWVDALRSDEFKQGKQRLRTSDGGYCCLGVACEIYRRETGQGEWTEDNGFKTAGHHDRFVLPNAVSDWLGLTAAQGVVDETLVTIDAGSDEPYEVQTLTGLNDAANYDFNQIADVIESEPEGLFKA
jgi:hypothetical protein